ncbi:hypothetical protein [Halodesulfovibrio marinisediminis]|uniref:LPP20 lipoprotein n=1 Tax=Halodesulfovibrio marinisediminis DSM 17456 TaxID=1121457 RepID=A0A1N6DQV1_9BACT|nr:hypothetical protein [Halodesulfovibrio marinisediminis]SIN73189.1 hypothetical protein SAMN02745161_0406 [Halodesulfovibrio marinisediminis DSM 17456]
MVSKRVLASVCLAALLMGTQASAEDTGVDSAVNNVSESAATVVEEGIRPEATQVQLIEQAIREVETQVQRESELHVYQHAQEASSLPEGQLSKVTPMLQYQPEQQVQYAQHGQDSSDSSAVSQSLYKGGSEILAELPKARLIPDDQAELASVEPYQSGYIEKYEHGAINWFTGTVTATGESLSTGLSVSSRQARLRTLRAATVDARKNLFEILSTIPVTEKLRVKNILRSDEDVMQFVRGDMQNSRITTTSFSEDGIAKVTVSIALRDMFLEKLIGKHVSFHRVSDNPYSAVNAIAESIEKAVEPEEQYESADVDAMLPIAYTGLLIDAREVGIKPAITVTIKDEAGNVLYSPRVVNRSVALKNGMVEYAGTWEEAITSKRSSTNPLVLKAVSVQGRSRSNIVISDEQALLLKQINNAHKFLEEGRVVVVCN